jgi:hypothetical protein
MDLSILPAKLLDIVIPGMINEPRFISSLKIIQIVQRGTNRFVSTSYTIAGVFLDALKGILFCFK